MRIIRQEGGRWPSLEETMAIGREKEKSYASSKKIDSPRESFVAQENVTIFFYIYNFAYPKISIGYSIRGDISAKVSTGTKKCRFGRSEARKSGKGERGERENLRKSPWGRSHLLGIALPPCTSSHPSFKTERFFICSRVTSERDVTSVHDSRFLKKKREKNGRRREEIVLHDDNAHEASRCVRNVTRERETGWQKMMRICTFFKYNATMGVLFAAWVSRFGVRAAESFAFARRMSFSLEGTYVWKLLAESKTPESER